MAEMPTSAHVILMREYGPPRVLTRAEVSLPPLKPGDVRIRSIASAVNHTDLEIRAGNWPIRASDPFPYIPGVEVVGEIVAIGSDVLDFCRGDRVITMMQGLGGVRAERTGGYAEYLDVAAAAAATLPAEVDPYDIAAFGLVGITAYEGLRRIGSMPNKRILVTGAAGGIGSAAVAIARAQEALVTGVISRPEHEEAIDAVGGHLFGTCVKALRPGGVLSFVGAVAGGNVNFDAWELIRPVTLTGYSSETLDGHALRDGISALTNWLSAGLIRPPNYTIQPLAEAARAHELLESHELTGRVLLSPQN